MYVAWRWRVSDNSTVYLLISNAHEIRVVPIRQGIQDKTAQEKRFSFATEELRKITGIGIDIMKQKIYFGAATRNKIFSINMNGTDVKEVITITSVYACCLCHAFRVGLAGPLR